MDFEANGNGAKYMDLEDYGLEYLGPMELTQYFIRSTNMTKIETGAVEVKVVLGRRLLGIWLF